MNRFKHLLIISLVALINQLSLARPLLDGAFFKHFSLGVEWGYTQVFFQSRNYNFISEEGYRVFENETAFRAHSNARVMLQFGYRLSGKTTLALYGGYMGMGKDNRLLPVALRFSFFPSTDRSDGLFAYAQGGAGWHIHATSGHMGWLGAAGAGYRLRLSNYTNLDLLLGITYLHDHPSIPNPEGPGNVPEHNIRMNNAGYCALDVSIAINF